MPCCNTAQYKRLQRVLCHPCSYTAHAEKHHTGLYSGFSCGLTHSAAHDTRPTKADITLSAPRWSVSQRRSASSAYQIPDATPDTAQVSTAAYHASPAGSSPTVCGSLACAASGAPAEGSASPPVQGQPGGVSIPPTPGGLQSGTGQQSERTGSVWHPPPGGTVRQGRGGRRGTIGGYRRSSFGLSPDSQ